MNQTSANENGWNLYRSIKSSFGENIDAVSVKKAESNGICVSEKLFDKYFCDTNLKKPSLLHSSMLRLAIKIYKAHKRHYKGRVNLKFNLINFMKSWDIENLRKDDFMPFITDSKKEYPSLANQAIRAVLQESIDIQDKVSVEYYLPYINKVIDLQAENIIWALKTRANAYVFLSDIEKAKIDRLTIVKAQRVQWWAWSDLAEVFAMTNDKEKEFACYCKALSLVISDKQERYVMKVRENFADLLVERREFSVAKYELHQIYKFLKRNEKQISPILTAKIESKIFENIEMVKNNKNLYAKFAPFAEKIALGNVAKQTNTKKIKR